MIKFEDIFPIGDERSKYPLLSEFVSWLQLDSVDLNDRDATLMALENNLGCIASASIITSFENYQELLAKAQPISATLHLDNGNTLIITPDK